MSLSIVDFSAQFGGQDAADAVLPHFKALKAAARGLRLEGFPFPKLGLILRVDGEVHAYGLSGAGNLDVDRDGDYLSVDLGINQSDRGRLPDALKTALVSSVEQIKSLADASSWDVDLQAIQKCVNDLIARYEDELLILEPDASGDSMKYFYSDSNEQSGVEPSEAIDGRINEIIAKWESLSQQQGSFLGIYCLSGVVLQFMWDDSTSVIIDIPFPERGGSLTKSSSFDECRAAISDVYQGGDPTEIAGLEFKSWHLTD